MDDSTASAVQLEPEPAMTAPLPPTAFFYLGPELEFLFMG